MRTLTSALIAKQHALQGLGTWIWLVQLNRDATTFDRYAQDTADVTFGGYTWTKKNIAIEPPESDVAGVTPEFSITIGDADRTFVGRLNDNYYRGQRCLLYLVNRDALSSSSNKLVLRGKIISADSEEGAVTFQCGQLNQRNTTIPRSSLYRTTCRFEFKGPCGECGYVGAQTTCDKRFDTCNTTMSNSTRYGGIPSLPTEKP